MLTSLENSKIDSTHAKKLYPIFLRSPIEFCGSTILNGIKFSVNRLEGSSIQDQVAEATGEYEKIQCGLAFRSIGYKSMQIDSSIPFDLKKGRVINTSGNVGDSLYAAGWAATGPVGVILSTMTNAFQVSKLICKELSLKENKTGTEGLREILDSKGIQTISYKNWEKIDHAERERGKELGKPREKIVNVAKMLEIAAK